MNDYKMIAICGKSASGKDFFKRGLLETNKFHSVVSCTSRPPRENEVNGKDYFFITKDYVIENLENFIEVNFFNEWVYGIEYSALSKDKINLCILTPSGIDCIADDSRIDLAVIHITARDKVRLMRSLTREENPDVDEIVRRYEADKKDFAQLDETIKGFDFENSEPSAEALDVVLKLIDEIDWAQD